MSFTAIRDQEVALRLLRNLLSRNRIPNGLLFWGPGGVGKRLTAIELSKAVNCRHEGLIAAPDDACDECLSCRKTAHGNHPDVRIISPTDKSFEIKKSDIDEINELAALRPFEAEWRLFILLDADRMNLVAQNHFLKTLEEPPGSSLFILVSEYPRMLLPTIRSRCQSVRFRALRRETVAELLVRDRDIPPATAEAIAALSAGQMTRALDFVDSERRAVVLDVIAKLRAGDDPVVLAEAFAQHLDEQRKQIEASVSAEYGGEGLDELSKEDLAELKERRVAQLQSLVKRAILDYLYLMETWYRDELVFASTADETRLLNRDRAERMREKVSKNPAEKIDAIEKARRYLDRFINEERVFRDLFFSLAVP